MKNKNMQLMELQPPDLPAVHQASLGLEVVQIGDEAAYYSGAAGWHEQAAADAESLRLAKAPEEWERGRVARKVGQMQGRIRTKDEQAFIDTAPDRRQTAAHFRDKASDAETDTIGFLGDVRERLYLIPGEYDGIIDLYCAATPSFLRTAKENQDDQLGKQQSWRQWLSLDASDAQVLNFLQWHVYALERQDSSPEVGKEIESQRSMYKMYAAADLESGWLHADAQEAITEVDDIKVFLGDIFDTLIEDRGGYHQRGADHVVVAAHASGGLRLEVTTPQIIDNLRHVLMHELNHAVLGRLSGYRWLDEALTEHIDLMFKAREHSIMEPKHRQHDSGTYSEERSLVASLLDGIPLYLATRAYSEREPHHEATDALLDAIGQKWGHYVAPDCTDGEEVLRVLNRHIVKLENHYDGQKDKDDKPKYNARGVQMAALHEAQSDLLQQPEVLFGSVAGNRQLALV